MQDSINACINLLICKIILSLCVCTCVPSYNVILHYDMGYAV